MIETPDYDALVAELGDPLPVIADLTTDLDRPGPYIAEAHPEHEEQAA